MTDPLPEIKARRAAILQPGAPDEGRPAWNRWLAYAPSDIDTLIGEVERLREERTDDKARIKALEDAMVPFVALHPEMFRTAKELFDPPEGEQP
jgi:hypothetical protein